MPEPTRLSDRIAVLRAVLPDGTSEAELRRVAASVDEWEAHPGELLIEEGRLSRQGFVLLTGTATVRRHGEPIARLVPGSAVWPDRDMEPGTSVIADDHMWLLMLAPTDQQLMRGIDRAEQP
jgi:antitoxin (DNA-binding transcriptional repressor) of toxin-antitoxin stability system